MLDVLIGRYWTYRPEYIKYSEQFFDQHVLTDRRTLTGQEVALIEKIDYLRYEGGNVFRSIRTGAILNVLMLSSGCKTAVNCLNFPDMIFDTTCSNRQAFIEIMKLPNARVRVDQDILQIDEPIKNEYRMYHEAVTHERYFYDYQSMYEDVRRLI